MLLILSAAVCLIGLVVYLGASGPKASEAGRVAFAMGLLATLLQLRDVISIGHR